MKKKKKTKKNKLPNDISEEEFLLAIDNVSKKLAHKFKFGYHSFEDMKQQATIFALECLDKYDKSRPLENFLWTHVRNRLFNFKRDNYQRPDKPCSKCPHNDPLFSCTTSGCKEFDNKQKCELYSIWEKRNNRKKNIMSPQSIEEKQLSNDSNNVLSSIANQEIIALIDKHIPPTDRAIYLKLKYGEKISNADLYKLKNIIITIIKDYDIDT